MKTTSLRLCIVVVAVLSGSQALFAEQPATGLEGKTEQEVIMYLETHSIPTPSFMGGQGQVGPPRVAEVTHILDLFKNGSAGLRLAIAKSLGLAMGSGLEFWNACSAEDYEARHYLVGIALVDAKPQEREAIIAWLVHDAHPSLAAAILLNLKGFSLGQSRDANHGDQLVDFLKELYRQAGNVYFHPGDQNRRGPSIQEAVVDLVPYTAKGCDLVLEWISAGGKKVDEPTLAAMWGKLEAMKSKDKEFWAAAAERLDLVEPFLLSPNHPCHDVFGLMEKSAWKQVYNPDECVRKAALRFAIERFTDVNAEAVAFIRALPASRMMRQKAVADAKGAFEQLTGIRPGGDGFTPFLSPVWKSIFASL